jgi:hypothetical protein
LRVHAHCSCGTPSSAWQKAGKPVELHMFAQGGHGFGMTRQSLTSDLWSEEFLAWMRMRGLIER